MFLFSLESKYKIHMKRVERIKDAHGYAYPHLAHSNMQNEITFMLFFTNEIINWTSCCGLLIMKNQEEELKKRKHKNRYKNTSFRKRERERREANRGGVAWRW